MTTTTKRPRETVAIPPWHLGEPRPFPMEPVIELCVIRDRLSGRQTAQSARAGVRHWSEDTIPRTAEILDVSPRRVRNWLNRGLTDAQADAISISLGVHPSAIWPNWFSDTWSAEPSEDMLERLFQLRQRGVTQREIARTLMAEGLRSLGGSRTWNEQMVASTVHAMKERSAS